MQQIAATYSREQLRKALTKGLGWFYQSAVPTNKARLALPSNEADVQVLAALSTPCSHPTAPYVAG